MPQTQSRIDDNFLQPGGTKIGRNNNIPGTNALIIGNSNNAFSEENLILGDFNSAGGKAFILGDQNITSDSKKPIFVIGNNNTTPPNSNGIIAGKYMTFSQIFDNGYVFGADGLYITHSINDFVIIGDNYPATQSFTHSGRVYINWDVEFSPDINVIGLTGSLIGAAGPQGFQGPFGGPQGFVGATGPQGNTGSIGNTGAQGQFGPTGSQGFQGNTGPQGLVGNTGAQGLIGPTGFGGALGHYGSFYSLLRQSFTQSENIIYDNTRYSSGITSDGVDKIFLTDTGVYSINIILNFKNYLASDTNNDITYYISKNGSEVLYTGAYYSSAPRDGIKGVNFLLESNAGDYFQIGVYGYTYSYLGGVFSPSIEGVTQSYNGTPIDIPSTILNVHQVMYTQIGNTGAQGISGPTGVQGAFGGPQGAQGFQGPTGVGGALGYYGSFYSQMNIQATASSSPLLNLITYPYTIYSNGVTTDGVDKIIFDNSGVYDIDITVNNIMLNNGGDMGIVISLLKNGVYIPYSTIHKQSYFNILPAPIIKTNGGSGHIDYNWQLQVSSNDYIQVECYLYNNSPSALNQIYSYFTGTHSTGTSSRIIPSSTLNVTQVMYTQIGPSGSNGFQGNTGPQGLIGNTGSNGTIGVDGNTGPQGFQGPIGNTGSNGTIGIDGNTGPQGFQGPQGLTGPQGALSSDKGSIGVIFDGFGGVPIVGKTDWIVVPYNGTITGWQIFGGTTGSCVIDVRKDTYGNFPPTAADSIAGTQKPTLITQIKNQDLSLSSWTASVTSGDIVQFYLESASLLTKINCVIFIDKN